MTFAGMKKLTDQLIKAFLTCFCIKFRRNKFRISLRRREVIKLFYSSINLFTLTSGRLKCGTDSKIKQFSLHIIFKTIMITSEYSNKKDTYYNVELSKLCFKTF